MTTGIPADLAEVGRIWVLNQLGMPPETSPAEFRAALLRHLPVRDFVLPLSWTRVVFQQYRTDRDAAVLDGTMLQELEDRCRHRLEEFRADFFKLSVDVRRQRWKELTEGCDFARHLLAQLRALEPGLALGEEPAHDGVPRLPELVACLRELFLLPPMQRAIRRRVFLENAKAEPASWGRAAKRVRQYHAEWAALEPAVIKELASWSNNPIRRLGRRLHSRFLMGGPRFFCELRRFCQVIMFVVLFVLAICILGAVGWLFGSR